MPRQPKASSAPPPNHPDGVRRDSGVQVLERASEMLRALTESPEGLTQAEIALRLGLARSTTHRLLGALADTRLVETFGAGGRYRLGPEVLRMADAARRGLITEIHPLLQMLSRELEETVDLAILDRGMMTFIDQVVAPQRVQAVSGVGVSFPLHSSANGKAVLAALSEDQLDRLVPAELPAFTENTIRRRDDLKTELREVRRLGYATDREENSPGICAVGVYIGETPLGRTAISLPIPAYRFAEKAERAAAGAMRVAAQIRDFWRVKDQE